jgi:hypothetical protein
MQLSPATARLLLASAFAVEDPALRPGSDVVAGSKVHARVPPGLTEGQKLTLTVVGLSETGEVILRTRREGEGVEEAEDALFRVTGWVPLPGEAAARIAVRPDEEDEEAAAERRESGEAVVTVDGPSLGPIELRLRLAGGALRVSVMVSGPALEGAQAARSELAASLERGTGLPTIVEIRSREPFDGYA